MIFSSQLIAGWSDAATIRHLTKKYLTQTVTVSYFLYTNCYLDKTLSFFITDKGMGAQSNTDLYCKQILMSEEGM